jgi:hypothetical protein
MNPSAIQINQFAPPSMIFRDKILEFLRVIHPDFARFERLYDNTNAKPPWHELSEECLPVSNEHFCFALSAVGKMK